MMGESIGGGLSCVALRMLYKSLIASGIWYKYAHFASSNNVSGHSLKKTQALANPLICNNSHVTPAEKSSPPTTTGPDSVETLSDSQLTPTIHNLVFFPSQSLPIVSNTRTNHTSIIELHLHTLLPYNIHLCMQLLHFGTTYHMMLSHLLLLICLSTSYLHCFCDLYILLT